MTVTRADNVADAESGSVGSVYRADAILAGQCALPSGSAGAALREIAAWMDAYISRPNAALGRSGDVCPWTRRASEVGGLELTIAKKNVDNYVDSLMLGLMRRFHARAQDGADSFRAIVAVFPHRDVETYEFIVATHARLKPTFLANRLMLGEFYPTCDKPGLHNPSFRPLRSPWPLLVIRPMLEADIVFLVDRDAFVEAYLAAHGERGAERLRQLLRDQPALITEARLPSIRRLLGELA